MRNLAIKRLLLSSFAAFFAFSAEAQITIKAANMATSGQNIIYTTSNDSIDLSQTGANTTWDFSNITPVSQDTFKYISATKANILYALSFNGDVALDQKIANLKGLYNFYKTATGSYSQAGMGFTVPVLNTPTPIPYDNPDVIYRFPLTYGSKDDSCVFSANTTIAGTFSVKIKGKRKNTVDGYGTIKTPYKTYACIRVKSEVEELDTFLIAPLNNSRIEYKWLSTSEMIPVMEAIVTKNQLGGKTTTIHYRDSYKNIVNPNGPKVDFAASDTVVFTGDSITLNNSTSQALTYNWTITPKTFSYAAGTTATSKNPSVKFNAEGYYTVSLSATGLGGNNSLTKTNYIQAVHNTGIDAKTPRIDLSIYPNPAKNIINLDLGKDNMAKDITLVIADNTGKTVFSSVEKAADGKLSVKLPHLPAGFYTVQCKTEKGVAVKQLVIE